MYLKIKHTHQITLLYIEDSIHLLEQLLPLSLLTTCPGTGFFRLWRSAEIENSAFVEDEEYDDRVAELGLVVDCQKRDEYER